MCQLTFFKAEQALWWQEKRQEENCTNASLPLQMPSHLQWHQKKHRKPLPWGLSPRESIFCKDSWGFQKAHRVNISAGDLQSLKMVLRIPPACVRCSLWPLLISRAYLDFRLSLPTPKRAAKLFEKSCCLQGLAMQINKQMKLIRACSHEPLLKRFHFPFCFPRAKLSTHWLCQTSRSNLEAIDSAILNGLASF